MSDSTTRFQTEVGSSLREINRQMTVLRDKNTNQQLEIQRLKTKLRIAAELKGVSVADLTAAMERVAMRDMGAEVKAKLKEAELRAKKAELSKEEALALSKEQQRAAGLELKIAEMTDREKDFEKMRIDLLQRLQAATAHAQNLQRNNNQLQVDLRNAKLQSMDSNETMDQMIQALQDQVQELQDTQAEAESRAEVAEVELTKLRNQHNIVSLQRTKLQMLSSNQAELITDLQGQLDSMYAAYTMQEGEIRSLQKDYKTTQARLENADMTLIQISEQIREEAQKQRDEGDLNAAKALERLDIGALQATPRNSMDYRGSTSTASVTARPVVSATTVFSADGRPIQNPSSSNPRAQARPIVRAHSQRSL